MVTRVSKITGRTHTGRGSDSRKKSSSKSSSSLSRSSKRKGGGTVIVTKDGLVTERDASGKLISRTNINPNTAKKILASKSSGGITEVKKGTIITRSKTSPQRAESLRLKNLRQVESDLKKLRSGQRVRTSLKDLLSQKQFLSKAPSVKSNLMVTIGGITLSEEQIKNNVHKTIPVNQQVRDSFERYKSENKLQRTIREQKERSQELFIGESVRRATEKERKFQEQLKKLDPRTRKYITRVGLKDIQFNNQIDKRYKFFKRNLDKQAELKFGKRLSKTKLINKINEVASGILTYADPILFGKNIGLGISKAVWLKRLKKNYPFFAQEVDKQFREAKISSKVAIRTALKQPETYILPLIPAVIKVAGKSAKTNVSVSKSSRVGKIFSSKAKVSKAVVKKPSVKVTPTKKASLVNTTRQLIRKEYSASSINKGIKTTSAKANKLVKKAKVSKQIFKEALKLEKAKIKRSLKLRKSKRSIRKGFSKVSKAVAKKKKLKSKKQKALVKKGKKLRKKSAKTRKKLSKRKPTKRKVKKGFSKLAKRVSKKRKLKAKKQKTLQKRAKKLRKKSAKFKKKISKVRKVKKKKLSKRKINKGFKKIAKKRTKRVKAKSKKQKALVKKGKKLRKKSAKFRRKISKVRKVKKKKLSKRKIKKGLTKLSKRAMAKRKAKAKRLKKINALKLKQKGVKRLDKMFKELQKNLKKSKKARTKEVRRQARRLVIQWNKHKATAPLNKFKSKVLKKFQDRIKVLDKKLKVRPRRFRHVQRVKKAPVKQIEATVVKNGKKYKIVRRSDGTGEVYNVVNVRSRNGLMQQKLIKLKTIKPPKSKGKGKSINNRVARVRSRSGLIKIILPVISGASISRKVKAIESKLKVSQKPKQRQRPKVTQKPAQKQRQTQRQRQSQKPKQKQTQKPAQKQAQSVALSELLSPRQLNKLKSRARTKKKKTSKINIPRLTPIKTNIKGHQLIVKTPRGFRVIAGKYFSLSDARKLGRFLNDNTVRASYKTRPAKRFINVKLGKTKPVSYKFRASKKSKKVRVEKRKRRIDTAGEKAGLKIAKLLKKSKLKTRKPTKRKVKKKVVKKKKRRKR